MYFNLSLEEGVDLLEWKQANIVQLFKKGPLNNSEGYRPVSLTSVICKLKTNIIDHLVDFLVKKQTSQCGCLKANLHKEQ